jgi:Fibronectin type III domain
MRFGWKKKIRRCLWLGGILFASFLARANARNVTLAWDPGSGSNVAGYRVSYGSASGVYTTQIDVGSNTTTTITGLVNGQTYFFGVTAYDQSGLESVPAEVAYPYPNALRNISTRALVEQDDRVLVGGFFITGHSNKKVVVRALGPSLALPGTLLDPQFELRDASGALLTSNDNWSSSQYQEIVASGLAPHDQREAAAVATLSPGAYTIVVHGAGASTGIGLVEVYDLDMPRTTTRLGNISARGNVRNGDDVLIGGFILDGGDSNATIVARAIGPSLANFGIAQPLNDPMLKLYNGNGTLIGSNNNWQDAQASEISAIGIAPSDPRESAILATLAPGHYTAVVSGRNGSTGIGLVEIYDLN